MSRNNASRSFVNLTTTEHTAETGTVTKEFKLPNTITSTEENPGTVTSHAICGTINLISILDGDLIQYVTVTNRYVLASSRIFLQAVGTPGAGTILPSVSIDNIVDGSFRIAYSSNNSNAALDPVIFYLIVNNIGPTVYSEVS